MKEKEVAIIFKISEELRYRVKKYAAIHRLTMKQITIIALEKILTEDMGESRDSPTE